ncbi:hypothetical protein GCM10011405_30860 [Rufibacter glacialis]|nr:hypothetical protein GCM10011405_30860 [Rufibacter glacialis]
MVKNQNLMKLMTTQKVEPWEYICAPAFGDENSFYGQYLVNITYLGHDKDSLYFIDIDGYLIKSKYAINGSGLCSTMVLTSTSVFPAEEAATVLNFNLASSLTQLIRKTISSHFPVAPR